MMRIDADRTALRKWIARRLRAHRQAERAERAEPTTDVGERRRQAWRRRIRLLQIERAYDQLRLMRNVYPFRRAG